MNMNSHEFDELDSVRMPIFEELSTDDCFFFSDKIEKASRSDVKSSNLKIFFNLLYSTGQIKPIMF